MREMRWVCERDGCFNIKNRLKFGVFDDVFPRKINFTDVDGLVEIGGRFCMMEWKADGGAVSYAQDLAYKRFTADSKNIVLVVYGNAEDMSVRSFGYYLRGAYHPAKVAAIDDLKNWLRAWVKHADHKIDKPDATPAEPQRETWEEMWKRPYEGPV